MADRKKFIREALKLAEKGKGLVSPNPMVGAVVAKEGRALGKGWHKAFGMPHAEIEAITEAGNKAKGATLYVNLEPCCVFGKTPPCTRAIINAGIKEVVCSMADPNPEVNGKGFEELQKNGIIVRSGILREEAEKLNAPFITFIQKKRPYVMLKWAQTLDGKTAACDGDSKWITSDKTRHFVKELRFSSDGIIVGINTVLKDNPSLDYVFPGFQTQKKLSARKRYYKIIIDPSLRTPAEGKLWDNPSAKVLLAVSDTISNRKFPVFQKKENCEILKMRTDKGVFSLNELMKKLYAMDIGIVMVEGGSKTLTSFWEERLADEALIFTGNKILGGQNSLSSIAGKDSESFSQAIQLRCFKTKIIGEDIFIRGKPCFPE